MISLQIIILHPMAPSISYGLCCWGAPGWECPAVVPLGGHRLPCGVGWRAVLDRSSYLGKGWGGTAGHLGKVQVMVTGQTKTLPSSTGSKTSHFPFSNPGLQPASPESVLSCRVEILLSELWGLTGAIAPFTGGFQHKGDVVGTQLAGRFSEQKYIIVVFLPRDLLFIFSESRHLNLWRYKIQSSSVAREPDTVSKSHSRLDSLVSAERSLSWSKEAQLPRNSCLFLITMYQVSLNKFYRDMCACSHCRDTGWVLFLSFLGQMWKLARKRFILEKLL